MPTPNRSLFIANEPKYKQIQMVAIYLFYSLQQHKKNKCCMLFESLYPYQTSGPYIQWC